MNFLFEIGCEEIPARFVRDTADQFAKRVSKWFQDNRIAIGSIRSYATPRRIAVSVSGVESKQSDKAESVRGPAAKIARADDGSWSKAALGFARKNGVDASTLELREDKGTEYVYAIKQESGLPTENVIAQSFHTVLESITFPKTMRWEHTKTKFIRPVRWLVCLLDEHVIPITFAGVTAGRVTRGHRFLGKEISLSDSEQYAAALRDQYVIVDMDERQNLIQQQLDELQKTNQWHIPIDLELLEEVTQLVEYPTVVSGTFAKEYLHLPKEVLITTMREHQRYFPVQDDSSDLLPFFVTIRNGDSNGLQYVSQGNEKVLRARLSDAQFFFEEDKKQSIETAQEKLQHIVYQEELGSMAARVERGKQLALSIAERIHLSQQEKTHLIRAASIAKFDQATQIVNEFPELEGYMGREYAKMHGEAAEVSDALFEQVLPRHAKDVLPKSTIGTILALADRFDSLASGFAIGLPASGSQDPYGFRKKAAAIIQIMLHRSDLSLSLSDLITCAGNTMYELGVSKDIDQLTYDLTDFFRIRLKSYLLEQHVRYDVIDAVLHGQIGELGALVQKTEVLTSLMEEEAFKGQVEAFTRVANLAQKADDRDVDETLFDTEYEHILYQAFKNAEQLYFTSDQNESEKYAALASMVTTIHHFFDRVMVMVDAESIRCNRLALLRDIDQLTSSFAAFDQIVFSG
jgi:glycyl-tRNA synthetase beta chain